MQFFSVNAIRPGYLKVFYHRDQLKKVLLIIMNSSFGIIRKNNVTIYLQ